ncbi:hypothetical protein NE237_027210 [Protea cynaroides]|uniref:RING-type E3 ubiquitin transferase n=1 Tax=Protea cynaroides TaxID=273540 RepID=A0A9Q0GPP8_9MAGN|nr:hypothetical protein NE237_027210 [Protea cynaroides]
MQRSSKVMEGMGALGRNKELPPPASSVLKVAVAITGTRNSILVIKWALESFCSDGKVIFKLLHVRPPFKKSTDQSEKIMLQCLPVTYVQEDTVARYKKQVEKQTTAMLLPFKQICTRRKVEVDVTVIEGNDIANAIVKEITNSRITKLVIGSSPRNMFTRKVKRNSISSRISEGAPNFCAVYVVWKGNLSSMRPSNPDVNLSIRNRSESNSVDTSRRSSSVDSSFTGQRDATDYGSSIFGKASTLEDNESESDEDEEFTFSSAVERQFDEWLLFDSEIDTLSKINTKLSTFKDDVSSISDKGFPLASISDKGSILEASKNYRRNMSDGGSTFQAATLDITESRKFEKEHFSFSTGPREFSNVSTLGENGLKVSDKESTFGSVLGTTQSMLPPKASTFEDEGSKELLEASLSSASSESEDDIVFELQELGVDRKLLDTLYTKSQKETIDASSQKQSSPSKHQMEQTVMPDKVIFKEDNTRELARPEKEQEEEYEAVKQKEAENKREWFEAEANSDAKEKRKLDKVPILGSDELCNTFRWEDVVSATSSFSDDLLLGRGAFGSVYKCKLHHTTTAVKVLHSKESHWTKQFLQELEILSKIQHPHLLLLLGACTDHGCLVYEYMEKGSLDDKLLRKDNSLPLPWFERYRIAWEVASALLFLHNAKPKPIVHRDLKPANILLDHNYVSKIGDVGLSTLLPANGTTIFKGTIPAGTHCYIDPEYKRTGMISAKSDVYAFGMVILQLLTAKPAIALTQVIDKIQDNGLLMSILDSEAGNWPVEETRVLAALGLSCTELQCCDRPDLKTQILPVLEKLKGIAERARDSLPSATLSPPQYFICPILRDVMNEPCVAADGYTYDRKAMELWLKDNDTSPMTNLPLPNKNLLPNFTLISAVTNWKSNKQKTPAISTHSLSQDHYQFSYKDYNFSGKRS